MTLTTCKMVVETNKINYRARVEKVLRLLKKLEIIAVNYSDKTLTCERICYRFDLIMNELAYKEAMVVHMRYLAPETLTLALTSDIVGVSSSRVLQVELKGLRRLKHPTRANKIRKILDLPPFKKEVIHLDNNYRFKNH